MVWTPEKRASMQYATSKTPILYGGTRKDASIQYGLSKNPILYGGGRNQKNIGEY